MDLRFDGLTLATHDRTLLLSVNADSRVTYSVIHRGGYVAILRSVH